MDPLQTIYFIDKKRTDNYRELSYSITYARYSNILCCHCLPLLLWYYYSNPLILVPIKTQYRTVYLHIFFFLRTIVRFMQISMENNNIKITGQEAFRSKSVELGTSVYWNKTSFNSWCCFGKNLYTFSTNLTMCRIANELSVTEVSGIWNEVSLYCSVIENNIKF